MGVHPDAINLAARTLASKSYARSLKIGAGEHLAAILLGTFAGVPIRADQRGEVDLVLRVSQEWATHFDGRPEAAFEVKSMPGKYRKAQGRMNPGDSYSFVIRTAADILIQAEEQLGKAYKALQAKLGPTQSPNIFLIVHPMEALAVETIDEGAEIAIGHRLPRLRSDLKLDTLWILWHPDFLTMWSRSEGTWRDMWFDGPYADEGAAAGVEFSKLQEAEAIFLREAAIEIDSPWLYQFVSNRHPGDSGE